jgi:hypothetical protein
MNHSTACLSGEELHQLLSVDSGEQHQALTEHLERCAGCQERLEGMATGGTNLSQLVERLNQAEPAPTGQPSAPWLASPRVVQSARPHEHLSPLFCGTSETPPVFCFPPAIPPTWDGCPTSM